MLRAMLVPLLCIASSCTPSAKSGEAEHAAWHAERLAKLRAPDSWLTLVGLDFLSDGEWTVGSSPGARLRYASSSAGILGRFLVAGDDVRWRPEPGASAVLESGDPAAPLVADDKGRASVVRDGPLSFTLVRRNGQLALRVRDNTSPVRTNFAGVPLAPYDPSLVVEARTERLSTGQMVAITNVRGFVETQPVAAILAFELGGGTRRFVATKGADGGLSVVFADATNRVETYGGGRFLDIDAPVDGRVVIDFNRAYNPPCSFTPWATCPLPPDMNRLPLRVLAGELVPREASK